MDFGIRVFGKRGLLSKTGLMLMPSTPSPSVLARSKELDLRICAFSLIELLVAMAILAIVSVLTLEILRQTSQAAEKSTALLETSYDARVVLDRLKRDISAAMLGPGSCMLFGTSSGNSALGFLAQSRARFTPNADVAENLRGSAVGYKMRDFPGPNGSIVNMLARGDGRLTYWEKNPTERAASNPAEFFGVSGLPNALQSSAGADAALLEWTQSGMGIVRFHTSFLLNDGTIVQTPPIHKDFGQPQGGSSLDTGAFQPVAFSAAVSGDAEQRFVKAIIVSLAVLDDKSLAQAQQVGHLADLMQSLGSPPDGDTAMNLWNQKLEDLPQPLRSSMRFFERTIPIN